MLLIKGTLMSTGSLEAMFRLVAQPTLNSNTSRLSPLGPDSTGTPGSQLLTSECGQECGDTEVALFARDVTSNISL